MIAFEHPNRSSGIDRPHRSASARFASASTHARTAPITVLIVDDHRMFAECLSHVLGEHERIRVVATASDGPRALALVAQHEPDVLIVDYQMPDQDGVAIANEARRRRPEVSIVMLSEVGDDDAALKAIDAGCSCFLTKDAPADELAKAVLATAAGESYIAPALLLQLLRRMNEPEENTFCLTPREQETLAQLVHGGTSKAIAARMGVSPSTIRNAVQSILTKLGAHSKLEAVTIAVRQGLVSYPTGGSTAPTATPMRRSNSVKIALV